ncbi:MAG: hypothetical protein ACFFDW_01195 [Candidatus Thorarchaeota archaeon]
MTSKKEETLNNKAMEIWGGKCKECGFTGELNINYESEKNYLIVVIECPNCGLLLFTGEDGKYRWIIRN